MSSVCVCVCVFVYPHLQQRILAVQLLFYVGRLARLEFSMWTAEWL